MSSFNEMTENFSGKNSKKLKNFCAPLEQAFGIKYFHYLYITNERKCKLIGTNTDLLYYYFNEKMHLEYPIFLKTEQIQTGLYLYDSIPDRDFQSTLQILEQKFQVRHASILARRDHEGCHVYGFAVDPLLRGYENLFINEQSLLKKFTVYFENEMQSELIEMKEHAVDLSSFDKQTKNRNSPNLPRAYLDESKKIKFLNTCDEKNFSRIKFTRRELEIIPLFLKCKSAGEISMDLFLSRRTVEHHLERLKDKLFCDTKAALFECLGELNDFKFFNNSH